MRIVVTFVGEHFGRSAGLTQAHYETASTESIEEAV